MQGKIKLVPAQGGKHYAKAIRSEASTNHSLHLREMANLITCLHMMRSSYEQEAESMRLYAASWVVVGTSKALKVSI